MVLSIGADRVIDYTQEDFTKSGNKYDIIIECVGNKVYADCRPVLTSDGRFVMIGAPHEGSLFMLMVPAVGAVLSSLFTRQKAVMFVAKSNPKDLIFIGKLFNEGKLTPVIDRTCSLAETPEAVRYLEAGHARGKVVVVVD
jgi:NADPH:quinone reductase-like Zn-dependent oxidoreductase